MARILLWCSSKNARAAMSSTFISSTQSGSYDSPFFIGNPEFTKQKKTHQAPELHQSADLILDSSHKTQHVGGFCAKVFRIIMEKVQVFPSCLLGNSTLRTADVDSGINLSIESI